MKKRLALLLISTSLLTACGKQPQETSKSNSSSESNVVSTSKTSQTSAGSGSEKKTSEASATSTSQQTDEKQTVTETANEQSAEENKELEAEMESQTEAQEPAQPLPTNQDLYATTLYLVATDPSRDPNLHYAFSDIDGNGTAELITARIYAGSVYPEAIYYLQNGVSTYLARSYVAGGGGRRESFTVYTDGTIEWDEWSSGSGGGTAYLYQLAPDNSGYWIVGQQDFNQRELLNPDYVNQFGGGRGILDMGSLIWNTF